MGNVEVFSDEDAKEIERISVAKQPVLSQVRPVKLKDVVADICRNESFAFTDPQIQKRCIKIVEARIRETRDAFQTREALERARESGGLGVSGSRLADMMERIERAVDAVAIDQHTVIAKERESIAAKKMVHPRLRPRCAIKN